MPHTPRLCIDGRAAADFPARGILAQEVIDQLVAASGEPDAVSSWIEKRRVVLLSHPRQAFSGQLKRYDTAVGIGRTPFHWFWEKRFSRRALITAFHRFLPADRVFSHSSCAAYTTLLPPKDSLPFFLSRRRGQNYVVPSQKDADKLSALYKIPDEKITVMRPAVRRFVFFSDPPKQISEGSLLLLTSGTTGNTDYKKLVSVIKKCFPHLPMKTLSMRRETDLSPMAWTKALTGVKACFYLSAQPFDWSIPALELMYWGIPTLFLDENATLSELLPDSPLKLSRFLIDQPDLTLLARQTEAARKQLFLKGVFDPLALAKQHRDLYAKLPSSDEVATEPAPASDCCPDPVA